MNHRIVLFIATLTLSSCTLLRAEGPVPIDQVPMYGGMDRSAIPELKAADEKLIADTTKHYGTREKASAAFINNGFAYYQRDDLANAMRRFNQAWLLDPKNPEVYAGFGSVMHDKGENCGAMEMMEKALALNPPTFQGIYPDAARIITLCAVSDKGQTTEAKIKLFERSESLYKKAEEIEPSKSNVYGSWATAYYWRGQYSEAWAMVARERSAGGKPNETFLGLLREKMPDPAPQ
jgi:tetratricopeptide (TPR) repeat protein